MPDYLPTGKTTTDRQLEQIETLLHIATGSPALIDACAGMLQVLKSQEARLKGLEIQQRGEGNE